MILKCKKPSCACIADFKTDTADLMRQHMTKCEKKNKTEDARMRHKKTKWDER